MTSTTTAGTGDSIWINGSNWPPYGTLGQVNVPFTQVAYEAPMKLTAKSHAVVSRETGLVVEVCDSHQDAVAAAKRRAAKDQDEFMVFSPACSVRPKVVDVEVVTLP